MMVSIKVFEGSTLQEAVNKLLSAGYEVADLKTTWDLREKGKLKGVWYGTGTVFIHGRIRRASLSELKDLEALYEKGGRLLFLGDYVDSLYGYLSLYDYGRFAGVKVTKKCNATVWIDQVPWSCTREKGHVGEHSHRGKKDMKKSERK